MREAMRYIAAQLKSGAIDLDGYGMKSFGTQLRILAGQLEAAIRPQWVPVSERLPEHDLWDVITWGGNEMHVAFRQDGRWVRSDGFVLRDVTHWHAIDYPQPPEVK